MEAWASILWIEIGRSYSVENGVIAADREPSDSRCGSHYPTEGKVESTQCAWGYEERDSDSERAEADTEDQYVYPLPVYRTKYIFDEQCKGCADQYSDKKAAHQHDGP
ncbi:hypothetical protein MB46_18140 [Arthrobacter alpinus]|nr:hypothetical protein MB46_18140 [Arthrobacter alpinus]